MSVFRPIFELEDRSQDRPLEGLVGEGGVRRRRREVFRPSGREGGRWGFFIVPAPKIEDGGFFILRNRKIEELPHLGRTLPLLFEEVTPRTVFRPIFGPIAGAENRR